MKKNIEKVKNIKTSKLVALGAFVATIVINAIAATLPLNGQTPGEISDSFPNLFVPAGITFSIWSVIYLLLAGFIVYQFGFLGAEKTEEKTKLLGRIRFFFIVSSVLNCMWIFSWHFLLIPLSLIIMVCLLITMIILSSLTQKQDLGVVEYCFLRLPFSVYFGWITVATIANFTAFFVSLGWNGAPLGPVIWTVIILAVGMIIGFVHIYLTKDIPYGLTLIWAYLGIIIKHVSADNGGFAGKYPLIYIAAGICCAMFLLAMIMSFVLKSGREKTDTVPIVSAKEHAAPPAETPTPPAAEVPAPSVDNSAPPIIDLEPAALQEETPPSSPAVE